MTLLNPIPGRCPGTLPRRAFLASGVGGLWTLGLPSLLSAESSGTTRGSGRSMIVLWLWGGPSHMETFDLKPDAPSEYRGEFRPIPTSVDGIRISEHLPRIAAQMHRCAIVRSLHHRSTGHVNSTHTVLTGYPGEEVETPPYHPKYPDFWSVAARHHANWNSAPPFVALPRIRYTGGGLLGPGLDPLVVTADPNVSPFKVPDISPDDRGRTRIRRRATLLQRFDQARSEVIHGVESLDAHALDTFQRQAVEVLTSERTARAFQISEESGGLRERYGRHEIGQRLLLARRLVEAGTRLVTVDFPCVPGQKAFSWDDHASVWNIFEQMKIRLPVLDQVVSALVEDLHQRGMEKDVLVVVMGEMGRTPKLSNHQGQPGREHWGHAMCALLAGGGLQMGQVIGETNERGEEPAERPLAPNDLLATWFRYLGIPTDLMYTDRTGRPVPVLPHGEPIRELF